VAPFHCLSPAVERVTATRLQRSLALIFVWRGESYSVYAEAAAAEVNFDTVFNRMFLPVNEFVRSVSSPNLAPPPAKADCNR